MTTEQMPTGQQAEQSERRVALVHVLTAEFQELDPDDFADIPQEVVDRADASELRKILLDVDTAGTNIPGKSTVSYRPADTHGQWLRLALTPIEYGLFSRHVSMLGRTAYNGVLTARDVKLRKETGNSAARARGAEDIAAANRAAVRQVAKKVPLMEVYLKEGILPRVEDTTRFREMTRNRNLSRGTHKSVKDRFEHLRDYVFGDMLDAIGNNKKWSPEQADRAVRVLQRRLYIDGSPAQRVANFKAMLELAEEYYGHKRAFVLTRIAETKKYLDDNAEAVEDAARKDEERAREQ